MKKLSVILLALAMTLSLAVVASAAEFSPYLGGEFQLMYWREKEKDPYEYAPFRLEDNGTYARYKVMLTGVVEDEETGTWAKIGAKLSTWNPKAIEMDKEKVKAANNADEFNDAFSYGDAVAATKIYEAGIKGLFDGVLDIWYTNDEYANAKRGQIFLDTTPIGKFGGDPVLGDGPGDMFAFDLNFDSAKINFGIDMNKTSKDVDNAMIGAGTLFFDGGEAYVGYYKQENKDTKMVVGGSYDFDIVTIKADYYQESPDGKDSVNQIQVAGTLNDFGLKATVLVDGKKRFQTDGGYGVGVEYTGFENFVLGARLINAKDKADEGSNLQDIYVGYNFGVFETRVGVGKEGKDGDSIFYAAAHVGMW